MSSLSLVQQNYIEAIHHLCEIHGHAHTKAIAEELKIRMASATEVVQTLAVAGYLNYSKREAITLTSKGSRLAKELKKRHEVLADFFRMIGCDSDVAEKAACKVEHNIDSDIADLIEKHIRKLKHRA
jgi:DtxR family Mn-dependent transcriptional regulator